MRWFKMWETSLIFLYMICVMIVLCNMDMYTMAYPNEVKLYITKLIVSASMISIQTTPYIGSFKQDPIFYILLWLSLLSVVPDAIRCILLVC